ncbi:MAG: KEOPS complex N(6)-L-threonylcarbamoyladenine synthase Kae1 [archaeon]|nr:tRNA (adenosine(37)-N6)-threonylcarbamoyltransferase complex transferase subunit TsaD [Nanoarchaeota archaeon]
MIILGIESTAHTFGVGIIEATGNVSKPNEQSCKILANEKDSYTSEDVGMIPNEIVDHHNGVAEIVLTKALKKANLGWDKIDLIAYSAGPGLDPVLWAGYHIAKEWAQRHEKKLVPVNHCAAHLSIGKIINKAQDPVYLYVSGVNTQIIVFDGGKYRVIGETLDIGLGNMLDKFGRYLNLGFPAGSKIEELSKKGKYVELPYIVKGMDISFSGILTKCQQLYERKQASAEDLCFSIQETCFAMLTEVVERAIANTDKKELILVGGVGANKRFCEMLRIMCRDRDAKFYSVPMDLAGDQGAMIAWEGYLRKDSVPEMEVNPHWRADEV